MRIFKKFFKGDLNYFLLKINQMKDLYLQTYEEMIKEKTEMFSNLTSKIETAQHLFVDSLSSNNIINNDCHSKLIDNLENLLRNFEEYSKVFSTD